MNPTVLIAGIFIESMTPDEALKALQDADIPSHTQAGLLQLIDPKGRESIIVTSWFAKRWCFQHPSWSWREV